MTARRIVAALVAAVWLAPVALAGGAAVHVVFDHAHAGVAADLGGPHAALAAVLEHGHAHSGEAGEHDHFVTPAAAVRAPAAAATAPPPTAVALPRTLAVPGAMGVAAAPPPAPPPQATAGPPLLALLSTLRL